MAIHDASLNSKQENDFIKSPTLSSAHKEVTMALSNSAGSVDISELQARIAELEAENSKLKRQLSIANTTIATDKAELAELRPPPLFRFTDLPGELRNRIYSFVLPAYQIVKLKDIKRDCCPRLAGLHLSGYREALFELSDQVGNEAFAILLKQNTIQIQPSREFFGFITKEELKLICNLRIVTGEVSEYTGRFVLNEYGNRFMDVHLPRISKGWNVKHLTIEGGVRLEDELWIDPDTDKLISVGTFLELTCMAPLLQIRGLESSKVTIHNWWYYADVGFGVTLPEEWIEELEQTLEQAMVMPRGT